MAVDKGAINWGHVLMLPVEHYRSGLVCPASTAAEMGRYMAALRLCYKAQVHVMSTSQAENVFTAAKAGSIADQPVMW